MSEQDRRAEARRAREMRIVMSDETCPVCEAPVYQLNSDEGTQAVVYDDSTLVAMYHRAKAAEAALAAERERADRAEADVAAWREWAKRASHALIHAQYEVGDDECWEIGNEGRVRLATAHPGATLLAALDQAREAHAAALLYAIRPLAEAWRLRANHGRCTKAELALIEAYDKQKEDHA